MKHISTPLEKQSRRAELRAASLAGQLRALDLELTPKLRKMAALRRELADQLAEINAQGGTPRGEAELRRVYHQAAALVADDLEALGPAPRPEPVAT